MPEFFNYILLSSSTSMSIIEFGGFAIIVALVYVETGLLLGFIIPGGESLLFTAGILAGSAVLNVPVGVMIPVLVAACLAGDYTGYSLGKHMGKKLYRKEDTWYFKKKYLHKADDFYKHNGKVALIFGRFVPVIRTFNPFISGATKLALGSFMLFSLISSVLWVGVMVGASYWLGKQFPGIKNYIGYIIPAVIAVALIPLVRTLIKERRKK
ncbi:MAG: DedA family protein [Bacteroidia bacterium]